MNKTRIIDCPELMKHWNYEKNKSIDPSVFFVSSTKRAFFKCEKGHNYDAQINSKLAKHTGCPVCANKIIIKGINDFGTIYPELLKKWDYKKNAGIDPYKYAAGSSKKVYWICDNNHSFITSIYRMTQSKKGLNCPHCRGQKLLVGFNDLATTNPELAKEWNYEKNELTPKDVIAGSPKKYWWKCKEGHEWYASLASRNADKVGCPHCTHQIVISGVNDFLTLYPEKAKLWDYEKNFPKKPSDFFPHSNKTVYWKCKNGHSYPSTISHITSGRGCPVCSNKKIQIGFNDLLTTNPEVAKEWNYDKNTIDIYSCSKGSSKKVWWKCKKGHVWKATISSRTNGCNCPECSKEKRTSLPEKTIYYYVNKSFKDSVENKRLVDTSQMELDIYVPSLKLGIEYDGEAWHGNVENDLKKDELCDKLGIALIRIRENGCPKYQSNSIKIYCENPHDKIWLLEETILSIFKEINNLFGLSVYEKIEIKNDFIEIYKLLDIQKKKNSLAELSPLHAKQWNYERNNGITPWMVANKTQKEYWWKCEKGHEWIARVSDKTRAKKAICPKCKKINK